MGWSLVQRIPLEYGVSVCDRETSLMRSPCPTGGCRSKKSELSTFNGRSKSKTNCNTLYENTQIKLHVQSLDVLIWMPEKTA
jgi:hypothetical protein